MKQIDAIDLSHGERERKISSPWKILADLHSHSSYAGGVGHMNLSSLVEAMALKGIDFFGTGDCLFPLWARELKEQLVERETGLFALKNPPGDLQDKALEKIRFVLQTELIFTLEVQGGRKSFHIVVLFPSFYIIDKAIELLERWNVKNTIGRPFIHSENRSGVAEKVEELLNLHPFIELIPAHVMTPYGVFGSRHPVNHLSEVFGKAVERIHAVETGLSADLPLLSLLPELDHLTLISNSDCHSSRLNSLGREFTCFELEDFSYEGLIKALRSGSVVFNGEMDPREGKYFLTGHRGDRERHMGEARIYSPAHTPSDLVCPLCKRPFLLGVLARVLELARSQGRLQHADRRASRSQVHVIPLIEVIAHALGTKTVTSQRILKHYLEIVNIFGNEIQFWLKTEEEIMKALLKNNIDESISEVICMIKRKEYTFDPAGCDGIYGRLVAGRRSESLASLIECEQLPRQLELFSMGSSSLEEACLPERVSVVSDLIPRL